MADDTPSGRRTGDPVDSRRLAGSRDYVQSLGQRRDPEALDRLVECLSDDSSYLRELAEAALLARGAEGAEALTPLLGQGLWYTRASAARVLGRLGHAPAAGALLALMRDSVATTAAEARAALVALARSGAAARVAWELHRLGAAQRIEALAALRRIDAEVATRLERLLGAEALMQRTDPDALRDDASLVREWEEGPAWELPTAPRDVAPPPTGGDPSSR